MNALNRHLGMACTLTSKVFITMGRHLLFYLCVILFCFSGALTTINIRCFCGFIIYLLFLASAFYVTAWWWKALSILSKYWIRLFWECSFVQLKIYTVIPIAGLPWKCHSLRMVTTSLWYILCRPSTW